MGYHITLMRSPPGAITWTELSEAARTLGWEADATSKEVRLHRGDRLVARVWRGEDGEPWSKLMDAEELGHLIALAGALGARARGDDCESYRTVDDWYVHPDDQADRDAADAARRAPRARRARLWAGRSAVLAGAMVTGYVIQLVGG